MNPFKEKPTTLKPQFEDWKKLFPKSYDKNEVSPYTKTRVILMNGTEFEACWFGHQFHRHCTNNDLRRDIAATRRMEKQQQMKIAALKPANESILEHTLGYEQLAVDLTAELAERETDCYVKKALDFALLEDFDHVYRYADLLDMESGIHAEKLLGKYTEIMPGRPTISEHRHPADNVRRSINNKESDLMTVLTTHIITAAEQQTMNYYMNVAALYPTDIGRKLYQEIGLIEEQHVSHYGSLIDPNCTWLENNLMHEYVECYLYYSMLNDETDENVKKVWECHFNQELSHLHNAVRLLQKYEKKDWQAVIPDGTFPELLKLRSHIDYVRDVLANTVQYTTCMENYCKVDDLASNATFYSFQKQVNKDAKAVPSHNVITKYIDHYSEDYRFQVDDHPVEELSDTTYDNIDVGRVANAAYSSDFTCSTM